GGAAPSRTAVPIPVSRLQFLLVTAREERPPMKSGVMRLYWKKQLVGEITEYAGSNFPWFGGKIALMRMSQPLRTVLEWFASQATADDLEEPAFQDELLNNWSIVKPDGNRVELLGVPLVRIAQGLIEWRE